MLTREHKRAATLRRLGTLTAVLVTSSLLFGTLPASAASALAAPPASADAQALALPSTVSAAAAKPLTTTPTPKITGDLKVGATLTAVRGTWKPGPVTLSYSWLVGKVAKGTAATYKITAADVGKTIVVKVTGKKTGYTTVTKTSAATAVIVGTLTPAPTPTISGTVKVGSTLTAKPGTWGPAPVALSYAWSVGGKPTSTTTATYKIAAADAGKTIVVTVTGKKTGYTTVAKASAATAAVPAVIGTLTPAPTPTITGTVKVGSTLTANAGTWGPAPVSLAYAWSVGGKPAATTGTTATYKIAAADAGKTIIVTVTGKKTGYTTVAKSSAATAAVPAVIGTLTPAPTPTITGTVKVGSILTAKPGTWGPAPVALSYAWSVGGKPTSTTTATYTIAAADAGKTLSVAVTGTKAGYSTLTKTSAATVTVPLPAQPVHITSDIAVNTTWNTAAVYVVDSSVTVATGKTLTIPAGVVVKFGYGAQLIVDGSVKIAGTVTKPVIVTALSDDTIGGDTNTDGGESSPAVNDWDGFDVTPGASLTAVFLNVRYAGGGIYSSDAIDLAVSDSAISGGLTVYRSAGSEYAARTITILRNTITDGSVRVGSDNASTTAVPMQVSQNSISGSQDFAVEISDVQLRPSKLTGNTAAHNAINAMAVNGTLVEDWTMPVNAIPVVFRQNGQWDAWNVTIPKGKTLTVPAGQIVKFDGGTQLVVDGALKVLGTAALPVVFTSLHDDSLGGDTNGNGDDTSPADNTWSSIAVGPGATFAASYLTSRYGEGITSHDATELTLTDSALSGTVQADRSAGSEFASRKISILRNNITDGAVQVASDNTSSTAVAVQVSANTVSGAADYAFEISDARLTPSSLAGNTATNSAVNAIGLTGTLIEDWSMPASAIPVVFRQNTRGDQWNMTVAKGKTLTLPAGLVLKFDDGAQLTVNGAMKVLGTADQPVVVTSVHDDTAGGDTNGNGDDTAPTSTSWSSIDVTAGASFAATFLQLQHSYAGVIAENAVDLSLSYSAIDGGVSAHRSSGSTFANRKITILSNTITDGPIRVGSENASAAAVPIQVAANSVSGAEGYALQIGDVQLRPSKLTGNFATGNTINAMALSGTVVEDWTMPSTGIPIVIQQNGFGDIWDFTVASGKTMTVPAGMIVKFDEGIQFYVNGTLKVMGTAAKPVVFTSLKDDTVGGDLNGDGDDTAPNEGDWYGINVASAGTLVANHLETRYGLE